MIKYWFSCPKFTVLVVVNDYNMIEGGAPFIRKFIGQPFSNLVNWSSKFGKVEFERLG